MCGILLLHGLSAQKRLPQSLKRLIHRGPDGYKVYNHPGGLTALGFSRLAINDESSKGQQPYTHGELVGATNGEIYNHRALINRFDLPIKSECDTEVILPLFKKLGVKFIYQLDGFYSGVILDSKTDTAFCFRDTVGKKPLFYGYSNGDFFITSELKTFDTIERFEVVPMGVSKIELRSGYLSKVSRNPIQTSLIRSDENTLRTILMNAVEKRMPPRAQTLGLFLSGGLDSSIIAYLATQIRDDIVFYTLADSNSPDLAYVQLIAGALNIKTLKVISLPSVATLPSLLKAVIYATESYNPSVISNGLATYLLAEAAKRDNIKVVLTGEGADELFCGYHNFRNGEAWRETRLNLIADLHFTELRRLDSCTMAHGVEARCPFLDKSIKTFSDILTYDDFFDNSNGEMVNKKILRNAFGRVLPPRIISRLKTSFDVGSGVRAMIVTYLRKNGKSERSQAKKLWKEQFNFDESLDYFHSYPVFDKAIDRRGSRHRSANG